MSDTLIASEALYAFMGWLSVREEPLTLSARHDASKPAELVSEFCNRYNLESPRQGWENNILKMPGGFVLE